ncbi:MAG TPA: DAK2 domain-containing protein [Tissierellia bacterium]|nr:DAK2 domain-containing protein [Tissierellia bacterium]
MNTLTLDAQQVVRMFEQGFYQLETDKELINGLNVFPVPDGDTGTNMGLTMQSAIDTMRKANPYTVSEAVKAIAKGSLMGARGNSGVILSQILGGFAKGVEHASELDVAAFTKGLSQAVETSYKAVMTPVEGTILTVIRELAEGLSDKDLSGLSFEEFFPLVLELSEKSLEDTPNHLPILRQSGVVDAGGKGLLSILEGFHNAITGDIKDELKPNFEAQAVEYHQELTDIKFQYCTEFVLHKLDGHMETLRDRILAMGDSMVFVQDDEFVKCHIHTNHPGEALENALQFGELFSVKIENMKAQHDEIMSHQTGHTDIPKKPIGLVAVGAGSGFEAIFKDFGVDEVVMGGQTMNPSTEDIVAAIERIHSDHILILPNNGNIVLAANQAKEVMTDRQIEVVESKTIPQGITALMMFDGEASLEDNAKAMTEALPTVETIQITYSVRTTKLSGFAIKEGDIIALMDKRIIAVEKTPERALRKALLEMSSDYELVTIYTGEEAEAAKTERVRRELEKKFPETDFEVYTGDQPVYYYIVSLE